MDELRYKRDTLPTIDKAETARKVRKFFKNDWPHLLNYAGTTISKLKSPSFDAAPTGPSYENSSERRMLNIFDAQTVVACVRDAINSCQTAHRDVLAYCFIDGLPDWKTAQKIGYSDPQEQRIKKRACCELAERLQAYQGQTRFNFSKLLVFVKEDKPQQSP